MAKKKTKKANGKDILMNVKITGKDRAVFVSKAKRYADGNLSAWIRRAAKEYKPAA